jgi:hypothetical protein
MLNIEPETSMQSATAAVWSASPRFSRLRFADLAKDKSDGADLDRLTEFFSKRSLDAELGEDVAGGAGIGEGGEKGEGAE